MGQVFGQTILLPKSKGPQVSASATFVCSGGGPGLGGGNVALNHVAFGDGHRLFVVDYGSWLPLLDRDDRLPAGDGRDSHVGLGR